MPPPPDDGRPVSWGELLSGVERQLADAGISTPSIDARRLVEEASGYAGAELQLELERPATTLGALRLDRMVERRVLGVPLQYVLGRWGFRTLDLFVDERVLIPRPETEIVVDHALAELDRLRHDRDGPLQVVDLGTGSGAIALSLAAERTGVVVWATDSSAEALDVARANLAGTGRPAERVRLAEGRWFDALPDELQGHLDLVVSNPPYIAEDEDLPPDVAEWEPRGALVAGRTGLEAIESILTQAPAWLAPGGSVVLELAPHQADAARAAAERAGLSVVEVAVDLAGRPRVLIARDLSEVADGSA